MERTCSGASIQPEDKPVCWICLDGSSDKEDLCRPCRCPRYTHPTCIARWQLQSAGSRRESQCDFCDETLGDWRKVLTPSYGADAQAIMSVNFDGKAYSFEAKPGAAGYAAFTSAIRKAFNLPPESELNITFTCDEPVSGTVLTLQGAGAYDAAVHCASVSAARRAALKKASVGTASDKQSASRRLTEQSVASPVARNLNEMARKFRLVISEWLNVK